MQESNRGFFRFAIAAALVAVAFCALAQTPVTVELSPCGTQTFTKIPHRILTVDPNYNDMLFALRQDGHLIAAGYDRALYTNFYGAIPHFAGAFTNAQLRFLHAGTGGLTFDKELLYQLQPDILHVDPVQLSRARNWRPEDLAEISRTVAPFFANRFSRDGIAPAGHPDYRFYSITELNEKLAEVYRETSRARALTVLITNLETSIRSRLPPSAERPLVALLYYGGNGRITPFSIRPNGFGQAHYRILGVRDAFAGNLKTYGANGSIGQSLDLEGLLAVDPDIIIMPFAAACLPGLGAAASFRECLALRDHPVARQLKAFRTHRVYPGGTPLQGPVFYLFQLELAAQQIYPERFPPDQPLFARQRLSEILYGFSTPGAVP